MNKRYLWLAVAVIYCIAIFITTSSPSSTGGNTLFLIEKYLHLSEAQAELLNVAFRKLVHLGAFGVLAILFYNGLAKNKFFSAWLITTMYAATDELHQAFIPDRTGSLLDVALDSFGAFIGLSIIRLFILFKNRRIERQKG